MKLTFHRICIGNYWPKLLGFSRTGDDENKQTSTNIKGKIKKAPMILARRGEFYEATDS